MKRLITILFLINLCPSLHSQFKRGLGFGTGTWGSGFHFAGDWQLDDNMFYGFELRFIDIKNEDEQIIFQVMEHLMSTFKEYNDVLGKEDFDKLTKKYL